MKRNRAVVGVAIGACAGVIDVVPMVLQGLTWDANISAFIQWIVVGFVVSTSTIKVKGAAKGLTLSLLLILPVAVLIGWKQPANLIPVGITTTILGSMLGWGIDRIAGD